MDKKIVIGLISGLVVILGLVLLLTIGSNGPEIGQSDEINQSRQIAEDWIENNSPTYTHDGSELTLVSEEKLIAGEQYLFVFSFVSSSAGYGDRSDKMTAQVITPHTVEVVVDNRQVASAITDGVYDEMADEMLVEPSLEDQVEPETISFKVYFLRVDEGEEKIEPVERQVSYTPAVARAAIEELLKGPLDEEKETGYSTAINEDSQLQSIEIEGGLARVDFNQRLDEEVAGSARVMAIRSQIEKTLLQFESIDEVIVSVDGRTGDILQP